jgi:hypothetical protein
MHRGRSVACQRLRAYFPWMPFKHNASRRHRIPPVRHRVTNWPAYKAGETARRSRPVAGRGGFGWMVGTAAHHTRRPAALLRFGDRACADAASCLPFSLPTSGRVHPQRPSPSWTGAVRADHSTLSGRGQAFAGRHPRVLPSTGPIHLASDSEAMTARIARASPYPSDLKVLPRPGGNLIHLCLLEGKACMARTLSEDLCLRVVSAVEAGLSRRAAAERFGIGIATAIRWVRAFKATGTTRAQPKGGDKRSDRAPSRGVGALFLSKVGCSVSLPEPAFRQ